MALRRAACELSKRIAGQQQAGALAPISTAALLRALDLDPSNSTAHPSSLAYKPSQDSFDHFAVRGFSSRPPASNPQAVHYPSATARVGAPAPIFKATAVVDNEFKTVSLEDYKGKFVVLFFYPKDFTFVCPTEIIAFSDRAKEFEQLNTQLIAASCDTEETHLAWIRTPRSRGGLGHMQIPILADTTKIISAKYGVLVRDAGVALRGLFVINPEGNIEQITINNMPIGRSVDETLRLVQAIQYVREHGEVCPADWKPGAPTMVADPEKSQEYFAAHGSDDEAPIAAKLRAISSRKEFDDVINSGKPTVVDFYAPWCGKCRQLGPFLDDMVDRFPHVEFVKVDTTAEQMDLLSAEAGVKALPAVQFYKGGKQAVPEVSGYKKKVLEDTLSKFAA